MSGEGEVTTHLREDVDYGYGNLQTFWTIRYNNAKKMTQILKRVTDRVGSTINKEKTKSVGLQRNDIEVVLEK